MSVLRTMIALLLSSACCTQALANPITLLQADDLIISAGGSGQINIYWETPDLVGINYLQTEFILTPVTGAAGGLSFTGPALPPFSDSNYVFAGNSFQEDYYNDVANAPVSNPATVYQTTWVNDTYNYNDQTLNGANSPQNGTRLWTTLDLSSLAGASGTYQLTIGSSEYDFNGNTNGPIAMVTADLSGGLITVNAASSVPEPGSVAALSALLALCVGRRWINRRRLMPAA